MGERNTNVFQVIGYRCDINVHRKSCELHYGIPSHPKSTQVSLIKWAKQVSWETLECIEQVANRAWVASGDVSQVHEEGENRGYG